MASLEEPLVFVVLSFEGPDAYARAGGLGARVTELSQTLARASFETHLFFVGDPDLPGHETREGGRLHLHRWCQWISQYHPGGVYDGEQGKLNDWDSSLVPWLVSNLIGPIVKSGGHVVVLAEEWQTAASLVYLADVAEAEQWTSHLHLVWNANHFFGFDRVRWEELKEAATVTTVSRYMRGQMARWGVEAHVVPNGIGEAWFLPLAPSMRQQLDRSLMGRLKLVKVARWDPDKGWLAAIDAVAELKRRNQHPVLIGRGGQEHHGAEVLGRARAHGLEVGYVDDFDETAESLSSALSTVADRDVILLESFLSLEQQKLLFQSADVVLANSSIEPFGLVGLQAMATGGIAFVGATGEDYATPGRDAIAVETSDPREIVEKVLQIHAGPGQASLMRRAARRSATTYMWPAVLDRRLLPLLHHAAALKDG